MNHQSLQSGKISDGAGASELYFGAGGWEGGGVNKKEAILISHAAVEELISFRRGCLLHTNTHTQRHVHTHALRKLGEMKQRLLLLGG